MSDTTHAEHHLPGLDLLCRATAEHHKAILELKDLFAKNGGELSTHFLTPTNLLEEVFELEHAQSFAVLNFSAATIQVGFGGRSATAGNGIPVPPHSFVQLPVDTNLAEIGATLADVETAGGSAMVAFIRYRHLVNLTAGPLATSSIAIGEVTLTAGSKIQVEPGASAINVVEPIVSAAAVTAGSPRSVAVAAASGIVIAANSARNGLNIVNTGTVNVSLGLGAAAILGEDLVLTPGGSWDGRISGVLWRGAVNAIASAAASVAVVEV